MHFKIKSLFSLTLIGLFVTNDSQSCSRTFHRAAPNHQIALSLSEKSRFERVEHIQRRNDLDSYYLITKKNGRMILLRETDLHLLSRSPLRKLIWLLDAAHLLVPGYALVKLPDSNSVLWASVLAANATIFTYRFFKARSKWGDILFYTPVSDAALNHWALFAELSSWNLIGEYVGGEFFTRNEKLDSVFRRLPNR